MAIFRNTSQVMGFDQAVQGLSPKPIVAQRAPANDDVAPLGTIWIDESAAVGYICVDVTAGVASWQNAAGGAFTGANLNITPGPTTIAGDFSVNSTTGTAGTISMTTNGGVLETIDITNTQGTGTDAISITANAGGLDLVSNVAGADSVLVQAADVAGGVTLDAGTGGITLTTTGALTFNPGTATSLVVAVGDLDLTATTGSVVVTAGEAVADAIQLQAAAGGLDADFALQANIASSQNAADAIRLNASAGGIDIDAAGAAGEDIDIANAAGSINLTAGEAIANALRFNASAGGIDADAALQINIASSQNAADAIRINASAGGIDIDAQGAAGEDIDIACAAGSINLSPGEAVANALSLQAAAGGIDADAALQINIDSAQAAPTALRLNASDAAGGIDVDAGTGGIAIDSTGAVSVDAAAASNFSVSGAGIDLTLASAAGRVVMNGEEAAADALRLLSAAGGIDANAALQINIDSSQAAAADSVRIVASAADGGMDLDAGTGGMTLDSTGAISVDAAAASNFSVSGAGIDLTLASAGGRVVVNAEEAAADAIRFLSVAGGLDSNTALGVNIADDGGAGVDITLDSSAGSVNLLAGEAAADAIALQAAAGGVDVNGALQINIDSSQAAAADSVRMVASAADGGIDIDSGTGGITVDSTGVLSLDGAGATNLTSSLAASAAAVTISASAADGGITLDAGATPGITFTNGTHTAQILIGTGSPNTVVTAAQGSLFINVAGTGADSLYTNTDGATAWSAL